MGAPGTSETVAVRPGPAVSRRVFCRALIAGASAGAASQWIACTTDSGRASSGTDAAVPLDVPDPMLVPFLTPVDKLFVQAGGRTTVDNWSMPRLSRETHRIRITGLVDDELEFGLRDLEEDTEHQVTVVKTLMCVLGYRGCALWTGVPLRIWLERAGVQRERVARVRLAGADGFENNLKWSDIAGSPDDMFEPLLAFRLADAPLPVEHGYPVRLLLADRYGYKNVKWLETIEASDLDQDTGQYQAHGYPDSGVIEPPVPNVESHRISQEITRGPCELFGYAISGTGAISSVELALDGEDYRDAELISIDTWRERYPEIEHALQVLQPERFGLQWRGVWTVWRFRFDATRGEHALELRARDVSGQLGTATTLHLRAV